MSHAQLEWLAVSHGTISAWRRSGDLRRVLPGVYAFGHDAPSETGDLWAAVLFAGPGAMLSHVTAAWWRGLIDYPAPVIHLSTARRCRSRPGIEVHDRRRRLQRLSYRGIPVTATAQTVLDLAAVAEDRLVRKALGRLDYRSELDLEALAGLCRRGRPGSAALRRAIACHDSRFGATNSPFEDDWLIFCETWKVPKPDRVNDPVHGITVDAHYVAQRLVVELDGAGNHHSPAQLRRDHANDLTLRTRGYQVNRYSWDQVHLEPRLVRADVLASLAARA